MVSQMNFYLNNITNLYNSNNIDLAQTLQRIASGKKFQSPSEDISAYMRTQSLDHQYSQYETIKNNLAEWQGAMDIAATSGGEVYNKLQRMKDLSTLYDGADAATKTVYTTEYNQLKADVGQVIDLSKYGTIALLDTPSGTNLVKLDLVPDASADAQRLLIDTGEAVTAAHVTALTPGGGEDIGDVGNHITDAITDLETYLSKVGGFQSALTSHVNISDSIMSNTKSVSSMLSDINDAEEMVTYTKQEIRQQASIAMITQANLSQRNVLSLYQFGR